MTPSLIELEKQIAQIVSTSAVLSFALLGQARQTVGAARGTNGDDEVKKINERSGHCNQPQMLYHSYSSAQAIKLITSKCCHSYSTQLPLRRPLAARQGQVLQNPHPKISSSNI